MHRIFIALLLVAAYVVAEASVYRYVDENGNVVFADHAIPGVNAQEITPSPSPASAKPSKPANAAAPTPKTGTPTKPAATPDKIAAPAKIKYTEVLIRSPSNDEVAGNNDGVVSIDFSVTPPLRADLGHKLLALIDGVPAGKPTAASPLIVENMERGSHTLVLAVMEPKGELLGSSKAITFHIQRITVHMRGK